MIGKNNITTFQLILLLIHFQIGVGVITLPYDVHMKAKSDAWISILLAGLMIQLIILFYGALMKRFPSNNLYGIIQILFGKILGKIIIILYSIFYISVGSIVLAQYVYFLKAWMMPLTPKWILLALMSFTAVFLVKRNLQIIARFTVISSIVFIGFIGASVYALKYANFTFILPIGTNGVMPIIQGLPPSLFPFQGFELLLIIYPFVQATNKSLIKAASIANVFVTLFYFMLTTVIILFFSPEELKLVPEPVLYLVKAFSFRIIERPDLLFTSMWIVLVATTFIGLIYASSLGMLTITHSKNLKGYATFVAFICFLIASNIKGVYDIKFMTKLHNDFLVPIFCGLPILFLLISIIYKKKEGVKGD